MLIISHRGESKYAPENTMSSFYLAYLLNSDGIECDLRKTKDNKFVIIHDKTINRTSNGKGKVCDYTLSELRNFNFGNTKYNYENIITLSEFLDNFSNKNIKLFIELKEINNINEIWNELSKYNLKNTTIISFDFNLLVQLRKISKIIKLGLLTYEINSNMVNNMLKNDIKLVICLLSFLNKKVISKIKNSKIEIGAWKVKNCTELNRINKLDLDLVICDSYYDSKRNLKNE